MSLGPREVKLVTEGVREGGAARPFTDRLGLSRDLDVLRLKRCQGSADVLYKEAELGVDRGDWLRAAVQREKPGRSRKRLRATHINTPNTLIIK